MTIEAAELEERGKRAFAEKKYPEAAEYFAQAADAFITGRAGSNAAEMKNNQSVALLQAGRPQEALEAALGTDEYFAGMNDYKRQAMALGNQAAALDALKRYEEAIIKYERSAELFERVGAGEMRSMVLKSAAAIKLKTGKITDSAFKMMGAVEAREKPTFFERVMRFILRFIR